MRDILSEIAEQKARELAGAKAERPLSEVRRAARTRQPPRGFAHALRGDDIRLIAEVKKASPSKGVLRPVFEPVRIARAYARAGASALSVLTDEPYFQGHLDYLRQVRDQVQLPVLRKDFTLEPYQIFEARAAGADAVLLIVRLLEQSMLQDCLACAGDLGMDALVEVHDAAELNRAANAGATLIGVNNRNLITFETALQTTFDLLPDFPAGATIVSESGIRTHEDLERLHAAGVHAVLVGEALVRQPEIEPAVRRLLGR